MATITPGQQADPFGIYVAPGKTAEEAIAGGIFNTPADAEKAGYKFYYQPLVNDPITTEPTIKQAYGDFLTPETAEEKAYRLEMERQQKLAEGLAMGDVDEATIRANTEKQFQAEIDALNRVYAEKKRQLAVEGQGRVGSATSVQSRRGLIGSDFGAAQTEQVKQYNQQIIDEAEAERAAKEANIRAAARGLATQEYQSKLAAKQQGAQAYLEFLKGAAERKLNTVKQTVANILSQGVDIDSIDSDGLAKDLGISVAELKRQYNSAKSEAESAAAKAAREGAFTLGEGQLRYDASGNLIAAGMEKKDYPASVQEYEYAKQGGYTGSFTDYQNEDANRKISIAKASIAGVDPTIANIAIKMGEKFDSSPIVKQYNEVQNKKLGIEKLLSGNQTGPGDVALIYDFMKALDPTSVVRESEYAMGAKSGNIFTGALAQFNGAFKQSGGKLSEQVKNDMKAIINQRYSAVTQQYNNLYNETARKMQGYGITDPDMFITNYSGVESGADYASDWESLGTGVNYQDAINTYGEQGVIKMLQSAGLGKTSVGGDTETATKVSMIKDGQKAGQCGRFVNKLTGLGLGDSYQSKISKMDPTIKRPAPGMVFVMPYKDTGHTGIILSVNSDGTATVKDSNYSLDEKVKTHKIPISKMTGFTYV